MFLVRLLSSFLVVSSAVISRNRMFSSASVTHAYNAGSVAYNSLSEDYSIEKVVVVHRHGDRSQISRSLGPNYGESEDMTNFWHGKMPNVVTRRRMAAAFRTTHGEIDLGIKGLVTVDTHEASLEDHLYAGEDKHSRPYAQLTQVGSEQLMEVGKELRRRYFGTPASTIPDHAHADASDHLFIRSTNLCRTLQSLRSLVVGMYDIPEVDEEHATRVLLSKENKENKDCEDNEGQRMASTSTGTGAEGELEGSGIHIKLAVDTRAKRTETLFPQAGGPCAGIAARRAEIMPPSYLAETFPGYSELEQRMRELVYSADESESESESSSIGSVGELQQKKVNWLSIKEVLTCLSTHLPDEQLPYVKGLTLEEEHRITKLVGFMWGRLYRDEELNKLAIGRFCRELLDDLGLGSSTDLDRKKKMLIYSGHDSTLVPLLCALGLYDDTWPPYASFLTLEFVTHKENGLKYVRATYNDQDLPMLQGEELLCPLEEFTARLRELALDDMQYSQHCSGGATDGVSSQAMKDMQAEIKATIQ